jgi:predicted nucleic acid-binding protein
VGVVVFDSDVLIGFLNADDAHHEDAVGRVRRSLAVGTRRLLCAVNYSEILIGPLRAGVQDVVEQMLVQLGVETTVVDKDLAERAAAIRAKTRVSLPDAYALATAIHAERGSGDDVRIETFDKKVMKAHAELHADGR